MYNKSKFLGINDASLEISFLVASIEALAIAEDLVEHKNFTNFVMKYSGDVDRETLDSMYGIRSKLFHTGNFSFFEFDFDVNPYSDPLFLEFSQKYTLYKKILRKTFISWIKCYLIQVEGNK